VNLDLQFAKWKELPATRLSDRADETVAHRNAQDRSTGAPSGVDHLELLSLYSVPTRRAQTPPFPHCILVLRVDPRVLLSRSTPAQMPLLLFCSRNISIAYPLNPAAPANGVIFASISASWLPSGTFASGAVARTPTMRERTIKSA
jgi:hypothetical protein